MLQIVFKNSCGFYDVKKIIILLWVKIIILSLLNVIFDGGKIFLNRIYRDIKKKLNIFVFLFIMKRIMYDKFYKLCFCCLNLIKIIYNLIDIILKMFKNNFKRRERLNGYNIKK